jgi:hypothetical protein
MRETVLQVMLAGIAAGALPAGALVLRPADPEALPPARAVAPAAAESLKGARPSLDSLARAATGQAPFRLTRRASGTPYDPDRAGLPGAPPPLAAPKPLLTVSGIAWGGGVRPTAVLEGLPGSQGPRALRMGEVVGGLTVRRIQPGVVTVTGLDTSWTLSVKAPWR